MAQQLRTRRFETRLDPSTDDLIAQAAQVLGESRSSFVVRAAKEAAEKVVAPTTSVTVEQALAVLLQGIDETELAACPLLKGVKSSG
jgi:uncharacterized protein (DUF1778 family)